MEPMDTLEDCDPPQGRLRSRRVGGEQAQGGSRTGTAYLYVARCVQRAPDSSSFSGSEPTFPLKSYQACSLRAPGASSGAHSQHPCPSSGTDLKWARQWLSCLLLLGKEDSGFPGEASALWSGAWPGGLSCQDGRAVVDTGCSCLSHRCLPAPEDQSGATVSSTWGSS